jgi:hypothetical protein
MNAMPTNSPEEGSWRLKDGCESERLRALLQVAESFFPPACGGVPMSVSELSRSRPAAEQPNKSRLLAGMQSLITGVRSLLGKLASFAFARVLLIFFLGFAAGVAWLSYGGETRRAIAGWSPYLAWVSPAPASSGAAAERLKATSLALAGVRHSVDKLATEVERLQAQDVADQRSGSRRASQRR